MWLWISAVPRWRNCTSGWPAVPRVLVWTTRAFSPSLYNYTFQLANGSWPYSNSHCLVLTGYDDETCYLADPMLEVESVDRQLFAERYVEWGKYAVVIVASE